MLRSACFDMVRVGHASGISDADTGGFDACGVHSHAFLPAFSGQQRRGCAVYVFFAYDCRAISAVQSLGSFSSQRIRFVCKAVCVFAFFACFRRCAVSGGKPVFGSCKNRDSDFRVCGSPLGIFGAESVAVRFGFLLSQRCCDVRVCGFAKILRGSVHVRRFVFCVRDVRNFFSLECRRRIFGLGDVRQFCDVVGVFSSGQRCFRGIVLCGSCDLRRRRMVFREYVRFCLRACGVVAVCFDLLLLRFEEACRQCLCFVRDNVGSCLALRRHCMGILRKCRCRKINIGKWGVLRQNVVLS